jgi:organic radical activating enzyme
VNLIITDRCNRNCAYCFAQLKLSKKESSEQRFRYMNAADFDYSLDFLEKAGTQTLQILGGEPTLHPEFINFVKKGLQRGLKVIIFTNGLWPKEVSRFFESKVTENVNFVINVNEPRYQSRQEQHKQSYTMNIMSGRGRCGFNVYERDFDLRFIKDYIEKYSLTKKIRLGLASPIFGKKNSFVDNADLKFIGARIIRQLSELEQSGIIGMLDCGFPLCMFSESDLGKLQIVTERFFSACAPVVDVGVDLEVWPCFPLSSESFTTTLREYSTLKDLTAFFNEKLKAFRPFGSMDDCFGCKFLERGQCCGGCLTRGLLTWEKSDAQLLHKMNTAV